MESVAVVASELPKAHPLLQSIVGILRFSEKLPFAS